MGEGSRERGDSPCPSRPFPGYKIRAQLKTYPYPSQHPTPTPTHSSPPPSPFPLLYLFIYLFIFHSILSMFCVFCLCSGSGHRLTLPRLPKSPRHTCTFACPHRIGCSRGSSRVETRSRWAHLDDVRSESSNKRVLIVLLLLLHVLLWLMVS